MKIKNVVCLLSAVLLSLTAMASKVTSIGIFS